MNKEAKCYPPCEAPIHNESCDGVGSTVDHFTPKCIGKLWGWSYEQINAKENIQYLSEPCHKDKDRTTEARLLLARKQLKGAYISLEYYLTVEDPNFIRNERLPKAKEERRRKQRRNMLRPRGKRSH